MLFWQIAHISLNRVKELVRKVSAGGKFSNVLDDAGLRTLDLEIRFEESQLLWQWKERDLAKRLLKNLLATLKTSGPDER